MAAEAWWVRDCAVMIARKDSQSLQDASVEFMIPGKRGITAGWYFAAITADMSTLPQ